MKKISQSTKKNNLLQNDNAIITGLIITAGLSSRMGKFKPLLTFQNKSFLQNITDKLDFICNEIVVVTGHNADLIENELNSFSNKNKIKTIFNENYEDGMFTSLQIGLKHLPNCEWVLYHFVDQPSIHEMFYEEFSTQIDKSFDWIQPTYKGKNGHPVFLNKKLINLIIDAPKTSNLKKLTVRENITKKYWECNYPEIFDDIDTIERYNKLLK